MNKLRPFVLSVAGLDPSGGAGLLADSKTCEQLGVYGLGICTGITLQTGTEFVSMHWEPLERILEGIKLMLRTYPVQAVKIGILPGLDSLKAILDLIPKGIPVVWDPVLRASAGFEFMSNLECLESLLPQITFLTPNGKELATLVNGPESLEQKAVYLSQFTQVVLKGGHRPENVGTDSWFKGGHLQLDLPSAYGLLPAKHGSGCIFSSALAAGLALGWQEETALRKTKEYIENRLLSTPGVLAYHSR